MHRTKIALVLVTLLGATLTVGLAQTATAPATQPGTAPATTRAAGTQGAESGPRVAEGEALPAVTIHLAGDSTVSPYAATTKQEGWGMELGQFFNDKVTVDNKAIGGANVKTFQAGNWPKITAVLKEGDYVLFQFGANDSGTAHGPVTPADYAATLGKMADEVLAKHATPIFVTPSAFYDWTAGKQNNARLAPYAAAAIKQGAEQHVLVVDLNARGVEMLNTLGQTGAAGLYLPSSTGAPDKAHFLKAGATKMAQLVAEEIRRIKSPLAGYLKQTEMSK